MLKILRNDFRELLIEISQDKMQSTRLKLKDVTVHKKFMVEGKASLLFKNEKCNVFINNAAPANLIFFLKTIYIKMTTDNEQNKHITKEQMHKKLREHLLSEKSSKFDEISPVTNAELDRAKKKAIGTSSQTTPSPGARKRKLAEARQSDNPKSSKQLYTSNEKVERNIRNDPDDIAQMDKLNDEQNAVLQGKFY
jgi:ATP-dependent DNA helicase PIF1